MFLYRITRKQFANLDGTGGILVAGRWHEKGHPVVYFSESRSLALLENIVHLGDYNFLPADMVVLTIKIPASTLVMDVGKKALKPDWENTVNITRSIGTKFLKDRKAAVLRVPTIIVPGEFNYLVNPLHKDVSKFKIINTEDFKLDRRIGGIVLGE
jgi:RES domain-containing protein